LFSFFWGVTKILPSYISGWFQQPLFRPGPRIPNFSQPGVIHGIRKEPVFVGMKNLRRATGWFFPLRWSVVTTTPTGESNWFVFFLVGNYLGIITMPSPLSPRGAQRFAARYHDLLRRGEERTKNPWKWRKNLVICRKIMDYTRCI